MSWSTESDYDSDSDGYDTAVGNEISGESRRNRSRSRLDRGRDVEERLV